MKLSPEEKLDPREVLRDLETYRPRRKGWSWREPVPPERRPLELPQTDLRRQRSRLLQAHEELAALSDANMDQFGAVIEALRNETEADANG